MKTNWLISVRAARVFAAFFCVVGQAAVGRAAVEVVDLERIGFSTTPPVTFETVVVRGGNSSGEATGYTQSAGPVPGGIFNQRAWVYDAFGSHEIGLVGDDYTGLDGLMYNEPITMNAAGNVLGYSIVDRTISGANAGLYVWVYNDGTTKKVNPSGPDYEISPGYEEHVVEAVGGPGPAFGRPVMNDAGQVLGQSWRKNGAAAWLYDGTATHEIGLAGDVFVDGLGRKFDYATALNNAGQAMGYSWRFESADGGISAWISDGQTTREIGLTDGSAGGASRSSLALLLNDAGVVAGTTESVMGSGITSTWVYDGTRSIDIGQAIAAVTGGSLTNSPSAMNDRGTVVGTNYAINGPAGVSSVWQYDSASGQTSKLELPARSRGGRALTYTPSFVNNAGVVAGDARGDAAGSTSWIYQDGQAILIDFDFPGHSPSGVMRDIYALTLTDSGLLGGRVDGWFNRTSLGRTAWIWDTQAAAGQELTLFDFSDGAGGIFYSDLLFLSKSGVAVGKTYKAASDDYDAFVWIRGEGLIDLAGLDAEWLLNANLAELLSGDVAMTSHDLISIFGVAMQRDGAQSAFRLDLSTGGTSTSAVPEPATYGLCGAAALLAVTLTKRRKRRGIASNKGGP